MPAFDMPPAGAWEQRGGWVVRALMAEFGLADFQAAGIVGNLGFESIGFAKLQEISPLVSGSAGGYGWGQWTGPRRVTFASWCAAHHLSMASDEANYGYLVDELHGAYAGTIAAVKHAGTVDQAVFSVGETYERPYGTTANHLPGYADRLSYARRALAGAKASDPGEKINVAPAYSHSDCARDMQAALAKLGLYRDAIDGDFGPNSRAAYDRFNSGAA